MQPPVAGIAQRSGGTASGNPSAATAPPVGHWTAARLNTLIETRVSTTA
jgi:hypothetical protein